jgi:sulfate permease, SulP family
MQIKRPEFTSRIVRADAMAGLVLGIESIPDAMASALLAAVNPIHGAYAVMLATPVGALFASSTFMSVQTTSAMSLVVASVPQVHTGEDPTGSLLMLAILTGIFMLTLGLLKMGKLLRFVPNSVLTGFINGIAVLIILGQLGDLTGYNTQGNSKVGEAIDLFLNLNRVDIPTLAVGLATIILILQLEKTKLKALGMVAAMLIASLLVPLFNWDSVALVEDVAEIPRGLPSPVLPPLSTILGLIVPAMSLAFVGLVQGAGVSQNYVNPDGKYPDTSQDFVGQGAGNIVAGIFQGMPVGGSVSATAIVVNAGARSRMANIFAGITMAVVLLVFSGLVGKLALASLAGLLIVIGFRTIRIDDAELVWNTGQVQQAVMGITFVATLLIPLQYAVLVGVAISVLLFVIQQSNQVKVKQLVMTGSGWPSEQDPPVTLPPNEVVMLMPYGSLFFASAGAFEEQLPDITGETNNSVVVLVLALHSDLGSTMLEVIERYHQDLKKHRSKLILSGVDKEVMRQLRLTGLTRKIGRRNIFEKQEVVGDAGRAALEAAELWIEENKEKASS